MTARAVPNEVWSLIHKATENWRTGEDPTEIIRRALWQERITALREARDSVRYEPGIMNDDGNPDSRAERIRAKCMDAIERLIEPWAE